MKNIYLIIDCGIDRIEGAPITKVSKNIYEKTKELLTIHQYDFSEKTENDSEGIIHIVKLDEPMDEYLSQFVLEHLD